MELNKQSKLSFYGIDIFETNFQCQKIFNFESEIEFDADAKLIIDKSENEIFKILMEVRIGAKDYFTLSVKAFGNFELNGELDEDERRKLININTPAIMFPYLRSFISTMTSNLGGSISTIVIPPHFFKGENLEVLESD
jgi:preprotein translocase subunit SecB